eukprot:5048432-Pleurochrysis_carterae.AAC.1
MVDSAAAAETCICSACQPLMVDMDDRPRKPSTLAHSCSNCEQKLHAPMVCDFVWFPVISSNAREFCSKKCMLDYNSTKRKDGKDCMIVPERYREDLEQPPKEVQKKMDALANHANAFGASCAF